MTGQDFVDSPVASPAEVEARRAQLFAENEPKRNEAGKLIKYVHSPLLRTINSSRSDLLPCRYHLDNYRVRNFLSQQCPD